MGCHKHTASAPTSTQHHYQQGHSFSTKRGCFEKHGLLSVRSISSTKCTAPEPTRTQLQYQKEMFLKNHGLPSVHNISPNKHTASAPTRTQLQYQQGMFLKKNGLPSVRSISTNKHTPSLPTRTQHQNQHVHSFNTKRGCF